MKLYFASVYVSNFHRKGHPWWEEMTPRECFARDNEAKNILESYHYILKPPFVDRIRNDGQKIFLDSGAFTAYMQKKEMHMDDYCDFVHRNKDIIEVVDDALCASVLDGIGDPQKTWENQQYMESRGVRPLPCFHYGEDERYLDYYVANYSYITLGGMVPISTVQLHHWLDRIWEKHLTDGAGRPKTRVHGFGLTTIPLMERYPWFSVDSSSWQQSSSFGSILVPGFGTLAVSSDCPASKEYNRHIDTLPDIVRESAIKLIVDNGFDYERLRTEYKTRRCWNFYAYTNIADRITAQRGGCFAAEQMEIF
jgi:hypothetical protein